MISWTTLTDGLLAAVVSGLVVLFAALLTLWRTRVGDRRREDTRIRERDTELRQRNVAEVIGIFTELERESRMPLFRKAHSQASFIRATMLFVMTQKAEHEPVATWLLAQNDRYGLMSQAWHRRYWLPWLATPKLKALGAFLSEVITALVLWAVGDLHDDDFEDAKMTPRRVVAQAVARRPAGSA